MARNIPSHQLPNNSLDSNRRDSLRPRISVVPKQNTPKSLQSSPVISKKISPQSLRSTRNTRKKVFNSKQIREQSRIDTDVTPVQSSTCVTNKSRKKIPHTFPSQLNSPTTSTPFTTKPNKPKAKAIRRCGNKTISNGSTYKCDECLKSFLSQRGLKIHLSVHRKAAQANTNNTTKNTTIWLGSALHKKQSLKDMRF